jgi:hypothetical protein
MADQPASPLTQDLAAWNAGFAAGRAGHGNNPHPKDTREAWSWLSGYIEGEAKREAGFGLPRPVPK